VKSLTDHSENPKEQRAPNSGRLPVAAQTSIGGRTNGEVLEKRLTSHKQIERMALYTETFSHTGLTL